MKFAWIIILIDFSFSILGMGQSMQKTDTLEVTREEKRTELFYDSLQVKASRNRFTKKLYDILITSGTAPVSPELNSYEYFKTFQNKVIGTITIKSLAVFGPNFYDTAKVTDIWIEKAANKLHTKSNLYVIRKNLWIKEGQLLDPDLLMDNERLLRSLPYLKDVRIILKTREFNNEVVDILIITQDVFSFGVSGSLSGLTKGSFGVYDSNILGIGHEFGTKVVFHTDKTPHVGFETYYSVNNVKGNFVNFSASYSNTYLSEGFYVSLSSDFLRPQSVYAGGITALRSFRANQITTNDLITVDYPLNFLLLDGWYGRRLSNAQKLKDSRFQINLSGRIRYAAFYDRPPADIYNNQYFANSTFYLGSLSFSHRTYVRDYLVYSYGITEDIPKGYLHELVVGYDHNEFGDRWYSHLFLSTGNIFRNKPYYLYTSLGGGGFFKPGRFEQGMVDFKVNFISPLFEFLNVPSRQFIKLNYTVGLNRFENEFLLLRNDNGIRGFGSRIGKGTQRLTLSTENVLFQKRAILNFKTSFFSFFDLGLVGDANKLIFKSDYYAGLGFGIRVRNEHLIFKTLQLRLAYYPNHPSDVGAFGFILDEVSRTRFYSFQPREPEPLRFE